MAAAVLTPPRDATVGRNEPRNRYRAALTLPPKNPYAKKLKKQVTLPPGADGIEYLINLYLRKCPHVGKKPSLSWAS